MWYGRTWEAHITSKHIFNWYSFRRYSFVNGTVSSPEGQVCCCSQQQLFNLALEDSNFVLTYCLFTAGSSTSTISACTDLGYGLSGPLTYTWHDPKFGISFPPCAVNFIVGFSWLYRELGMMLVSAPKSIWQKAWVCFPLGLSTRCIFKRAFCLQETTWPLLVKGVALGP